MPAELTFYNVLRRSIEISQRTLDNFNERDLRVQNELDIEDPSNIYTIRSAKKQTYVNKLEGLVDAALRGNGFVPSWVTDQPISEDGILNSGSIVLDRIAGMKTNIQLTDSTVYPEDFTPVLRLTPHSGKELLVVHEDLSQLDLADYAMLSIEVQYRLVKMSVREIIEKWQEGYHRLPEGDVELHDIFDNTGERITGAYSLRDMITVIEPEDLSSERYQLKNCL